jgi:hypothetical protein
MRVPYNASEQVPTWRVDMRAKLPSGYGETFEALVMVSGSEDVPYRVLDWRRTVIDLE